MESDASIDYGTRMNDFVFEEETNDKEAAIEEVDRNTEMMTPITIVTDNMGSIDSDEPCNEPETARDTELPNNVVVQYDIRDVARENHQLQPAQEDNSMIANAANVRMSSRVRKPRTLSDFVYMTELQDQMQTIG